MKKVKQIYLASESKQRKKLFSIFGLEFKILRGVNAPELKNKGKYSLPGLVKRNALTKARAAAKRIKAGIVIGADTLVSDGKHVFGKPSDLKDARKMLKKLTQRPQWVYTGIAVMDKDSGKTQVSCEKTRVYMDELTDEEIDRYFSYVSPLDKAGGFDIQGKGSFFIRRIEGCFYNVVGLPLRRVYLMLKKMGVRIFFVFMTVIPAAAGTFISGCSTEYNIATRQEETFFYSTDHEIKIGRSISKEIEKKYELYEDPLMVKRVNDIGRKIVGVCDRKDIQYTFKVLDSDEINAVSLPGGFVYINKGLIEKTVSDDELAGVIAHEIGHIVARHSIKKLQAMMGYTVLRAFTVAIPETSQVMNAADLAFSELMLGYGREDELLADQLSVRYLRRAGYDPYGIVRFLQKLQEIERRRPPRQKTYFKTHPYVPDRVRVVKEEMGEKISFTDYINIEQKEHE